MESMWFSILIAHLGDLCDRNEFLVCGLIELDSGALNPNHDLKGLLQLTRLQGTDVQIYGCTGVQENHQ